VERTDKAHMDCVKMYVFRLHLKVCMVTDSPIDGRKENYEITQRFFSKCYRKAISVRCAN